MASSDFKPSKKCPNCGQWSEWNQQASDTCQHCGALLDDENLIRTAAREAEKSEQKGFDLDIIQIHPNDAWYVVFYKRIIQGLQYSFIAIMTFILWVLALIAG
jgi:hypothetical protein